MEHLKIKITLENALDYYCYQCRFSPEHCEWRVRQSLHELDFRAMEEVVLDDYVLPPVLQVHQWKTDPLLQESDF